MLPVKFKCFYREFRRREFALLDVGCGNHSPTLTKRYFPKCHYHGIDKGNYNNDESDFALMERPYEIDLSSDDLRAIPDAFFDVVMFSHVIEHLTNGLEVVARLCRKLRPGGKLYVEFPGVRSLSLPSASNTLQFCDDPTHVRLYDVREIANVMLANGMRVLRAGTRKDWLRRLLYPLSFLRNLALRATGRKISSRGLWYVKGFAEFVYGEKMEKS